jgi:hypothetical protein
LIFKVFLLFEPIYYTLLLQICDSCGFVAEARSLASLSSVSYIFPLLSRNIHKKKAGLLSALP